MHISTKPESSAAKAVADTGTVARVAMLLGLIAEKQGVFAFSDLVNESGLPGPTVHRLLDLLTQQGLVAHEKSLRSYRVGAELYRISALIRTNVPLAQVIRPILAEGAHEAGESCYFALYLPAQLAVMYESRVDSTHALDFRLEFNRPMSLLWGASGRAILAHLSARQVQAALAQEHKFSSSGEVPDEAQLQAELQGIRESGYAFSKGQRIPGAFGVLAPVFDGTGSIYGALGFTVPEQRFTESRLPSLAQSAMRYAAQVSRSLGAKD